MSCPVHERERDCEEEEEGDEEKTRAWASAVVKMSMSPLLLHVVVRVLGGADETIVPLEHTLSSSSSS
jgi:hypothetical protein